MNKAVKYLAFVLEESQREGLLELAGEIPANWKRYGHHVTLDYGVTDDVQFPNINTVVLIAMLKNTSCIAGLVEVNGTSIRADGKVYHLTIATAPGIKPAYSNVMIEEGNFDTIAIPETYSDLSYPIRFDGEVKLLP